VDVGDFALRHIFGDQLCLDVVVETFAIRATACGTGGAHKRVDTVRIINPALLRGASLEYLNGYVKYQNVAGQGVNPITEQTLPNIQSHFVLTR
jgi:hypothetical protein